MHSRFMIQDISDSDNRTSLNSESKEETIENKRKKITVRGLSGLVNIGNTCYLNSIVQCLSQLTLFSSYMQSDSYMSRLFNRKKYDMIISMKKKMNHDDDSKLVISDTQVLEECKETVTYRLSELLKKMWEVNRDIAPRNFKRLISNICPTFVGSTQNDSQELLNLILDRIHEETKADVETKYDDVSKGVIDLIEVRNKCMKIVKDINSTIEQKRDAHAYYKDYRKNHLKDTIDLKAYVYWKKYLKNNHSIITDLFTGLFYSQVECCECGNISPSFEPFSMLSIETKEFGDTTLEECLKNFSQEEILTGDNKLTCSVCNKKVDIKKKQFIWESPQIVIIHLKRFNNTGNRCFKTNSTIKFPLRDLQLTDNYCDLHTHNNKKYDLCAISEHRGAYGFGHYVAHCKSGINNKWYEFNDDDTVHVPNEDIEGEIVTKNAYILIYTLQNSTTVHSE